MNPIFIITPYTSRLTVNHLCPRPELFEPRIKLRSASQVSKCFIYRFLLDHRILLLNVNCGVKIVYDMYVVSHH